MSTALTAAGINYTLHFYEAGFGATVYPTVEYTFPIPPTGGPPQTKTVAVKATTHADCWKSRPILDPFSLMPAVGLDPLYNSEMEISGNATTGVDCP